MQNEHERRSAAVTRLLLDHKIPMDQWGRKGAKSLASLLLEVANGECEIIENESGELLRVVRIVALNVFYTDPDGNTFELVEDRQVINNETRRRNLNSSVSEKMMPGEEPLDAVRRGLQEELGILVDSVVAEKTGEETQVLDSPSYPGLKTQYIRIRYRVTLSHDQYREQYSEKHLNVTTYFIWKKV